MIVYNVLGFNVHNPTIQNTSRLFFKKSLSLNFGYWVQIKNLQICGQNSALILVDFS